MYNIGLLRPAVRGSEWETPQEGESGRGHAAGKKHRWEWESWLTTQFIAHRRLTAWKLHIVHLTHSWRFCPCEDNILGIILFCTAQRCSWRRCRMRYSMFKQIVAYFVYLLRPYVSNFVATDINVLFNKSVKKICNIMFKTRGGGGSTDFWTMFKKLHYWYIKASLMIFVPF